MSENVPTAEALVNLLSAWGTLPAHKFHKAYPFFDVDRDKAIEEYGLIGDDRAKLEATALLFSDYADDIYVAAQADRSAKRQDPKGLDPKDESAVPKGNAP